MRPGGRYQGPPGVRILGMMPALRPAFYTILGLTCLMAGALRARGDDADLRRSAVVRLVEQARPAVVSIRTNQIVRRTWFDPSVYQFRSQLHEQDGGLGSGVIFHPDGYVITNAHVISRASSILVNVGYGSPEGAVELRALPVAVDLNNDLAIVRLLPQGADAPARFPYLRLGRSNDLLLGEDVVAIGHPFRLGLTVTRGIVSGLNRRLSLGTQVFDDFMQVDAAINPGNSGGPLFDISGRWIGVNTAIYNRASLSAEGIGFAIPADRVRSLIARTFKQRVVLGRWMGLEFEEGADGQAIVQTVYPKGPARDSGIEVGDVIRKVEEMVTPTLYDVRIALVSDRLVERVKLTVERGARVREISVGVEELPTDRLSRAHLGFTAEDKEDFDGVIVSEVRSGGPGERAKLAPGDVIVALGRWKVRNSEDLLMFLQYVAAGDEVDITVQRARRDPSGRVVGMRELKGSMLAD